MSRIDFDFTFIDGLLEMVARRGLRTLIVKALRLWRRESLPGVVRALRQIARDYRYLSYLNWFRDFGRLRQEDRVIIRRHIGAFAQLPRLSILIPTCGIEPVLLRRALNSVAAQIYPHWELCIVHDLAATAQANAMLLEFCRQDERIRIVANTDPQSVTGEFFMLLDPRDALAEHALYLVAAALEHDPALDMLYSDEDSIDATGRHDAPSFKPDWNPDLFLSHNFVCHLGAYRTSLMRAVGGLRPAFGGAQEWDLALRIAEMIPPERISHLPYVLYHRHADATAEDAASLVAGMAAVGEYLTRTRTRAELNLVGTAGLRVHRAPPKPPPLVSILVPTRNGMQLLRRCIDSLIERTAHTHYEIIVIDNQSNDLTTLAYLDELASSGIARVLKYDAPFNYSAINNYAARQAHGSLLCLLNNDIEVIGEDWLGEMVSQAVRPEIGAVGALLYYPDDTIQHAGTIVGLSGCADHLYAGSPRGTTGMMGRVCLVQNFSAVTAACLVIRKEIFDAVGGFDSEHLPVSFNDVDFCLRVIELGYRNLWTPFAELYHHESASRGPEDSPAKLQRVRKERTYMRTRWPQFMKNDPAFNPNLSLDDKRPRQGADPRIQKPWLAG